MQSAPILQFQIIQGKCLNPLQIQFLNFIDHCWLQFGSLHAAKL
jgi:hypothetical protein